MQTKQQVATKQQKVQANNAIVRMQQRIAAVQALRASKHAARIAVKQQQAFIAQVQQHAAQYGIAPAQVQAMLHAVQKGAPAARANSATQAPSNALVTVQGVPLKPCAAVHALCAQYPHYTRKEMLQLCTDNGINPATASTQVGKYRAAKAAEAAE